MRSPTSTPTRAAALVLTLAGFLVSGCGGTTSTGADGSEQLEPDGSAVGDSGAGADAGVEPDAGEVEPDAGEIEADAGGIEPDAGSESPDSGASAPSRFTGSAPTTESCPLGALFCNAHWPRAAQGTVDLYEVAESFRDGSTLARTFHVYRPARASGRVPALVTLHGGHGTGVRFLEQFAPLADARGDTGITWEKNRNLCFYTHPDGFQTPGGAPCTPTEATVYNAQPFLLVMPDGIFDEGSTSSRHWEDGRVPSPGSTQVAERRDDVGFLNHIVGVLRAHPSVDPTRIYVAGVSNGGMMVQRLACSMESPDYPNLARVAAWGSFVASMTEPVFDGTDGRPRCPRTGTLARPMAFFVGTGIDTPYCATEQVCAEPLTGDGDGIVVYGSAGGRYCLAGASEGGCTVAVPDSAALWTSFHAAWGAASTNDLTVGLFTQARHTTFADTQARVTVLTTDGGAHTTGSSRHDFEPWARMWAFLSSFSRDGSGQVSASLPTHVEGEY